MEPIASLESAELIPEVLYEPDFAPNHLSLFERLRVEVGWDARWHSRQTACFGLAYDYSDITYSAVPMPEPLLALASQIEQRVGLAANSCLLNYYRDDHSQMGFHTDNEKPLVPGTGVAIVSLGAPRTLQFRHKNRRSEVVSYRLESGSLLYMPLEVQREWRHGVPAEPGSETRISLTFRRLRDPNEETRDGGSNLASEIAGRC